MQAARSGVFAARGTGSWGCSVSSTTARNTANHANFRCGTLRRVHSALLLVLLISLGATSAFAGADSVSVTGNLDITADDVAGSTYGGLTVDPEITEGGIGQWDTNDWIMINAPSGFSFNTGITPTANVNPSGASISFFSVSATQILFQVSAPGTVATVATFSNIELRSDNTACTPHGQIGARSPITVMTPGSGALVSATVCDVNVVPGAIDNLEFTTQPNASYTAGTLISVEVTAKDQCGNVVDDSINSIDLTLLNAGGAALDGTTTATMSAGVATWGAVEDLHIDKTGTGYQLQAGYAAITEDSNAFNVTPAAAASIAFATGTEPANCAAGTVLTPQIEILDTYGNICNVTDSIALTLQGHDNTLLKVDTSKTKAAVSGVATWNGGDNLRIEAADTGYILHAENTNTGHTVTAGPFEVSHNVAHHLTISGVVDTPAGDELTPVVTFVDTYGNTVLTETQEVTFTISQDGGPSPPTPLEGTTSKNAVAGIADWTGLGMNIEKAGTYKITADADDAGMAGGDTVESAAFTITPLPTPRYLVFDTQPGNTTAGDPITFMVAIQDEFYNTITTGAADRNISIAIEADGGDSPPTTLHNNGQQAAVNGAAQWTAGVNLNIQDDGTYSLRATADATGDFAPGSGTVVSSTFDITPAAAASVVFAPGTEPSDCTAGDNLTPEVQILDTYGNVCNVTDTIALTLNGHDNALLLAGTSKSKAATAGRATWNAGDTLRIETADTGYVLHAENTNTGHSVDSAPFDVSPDAAHHLAISTIADTQAGDDLAFTVTVQDQYDNIVDVDGRTIEMTIDTDPPPGGTTLQGTTTTTTTAGEAIWGGAGASMQINRADSGFKLQAECTSGGALPGGDTVVSNAFTIDPRQPHHVEFATQPTDPTGAGEDLLPVVHMVDEHGNLVTTPGYQQNITLSIMNDPPPGGTTLHGTKTVVTSGGVATWQASDDLNIQRMAVGYTLKAQAANPGDFVGANGDWVESAAFEITVGPPHHIAFAPSPSDTTAGEPIQFTVQIQDQYDNLVTAAAPRNITISLENDPHGGSTTLINAGAKPTSSGEVSWIAGDDLNIETVGNGYTLKATADGAALPGGNEATCATFDITHAAAHHLVFTTQPQNRVAGVPIEPEVTVVDEFGNTVTTGGPFNITIALEDDPHGTTTLINAGAKATVGGIATWGPGDDLNIEVVGNNYTLLADANDGSMAGGDTLESATFNITHAAAHHLAYTTQPTDVVAGTPITLEVTVQDEFGNTTTGEAHTISLSIANDAGPTPPTTLHDMTPKATVNGVATWAVGDDLDIRMVGSGYTLLADANDGSMAGGDTLESATFNITHAAADHLVFTTQPQNRVAGVPIEPEVTVVDEFGNTVTTGGPFNITIALEDDPHGTTTLINAGAKATVGGIATWGPGDDLNIEVVGNNYTLLADANDGSMAGGDTLESAAFNITAEATAHHLEFDPPPGNTVAAVPLSFTVKICDQFGNKVTTDDCDIELSLVTPPTGPLLGADTTLPTTNGEISWDAGTPVWIENTDTGYRLQAKGVGTAFGGSDTVVSGTFNITPATLDHFDVAPSTTSLTVNSGVTVTLTARDQYDNAVPNWTTTQDITISTTPAGTGTTLDYASAIPGFTDNGATATIPAGTSFDGSAELTFTVTNRTAETATITADDAVTPATGTSVGVTWAADGLDDYLLQVDTTTPTAGQVATFTLTALDQFDNPIPNFVPANDITISTVGAGVPAVTFAGSGVTDGGNSATIDKDEPGLFNGVGRATFTVAHTKSGETITFSADDTTATSNGVDVTWQAAALDNFLLEVDTSTPVAGNAATFTLTARDVFNNPIPNYDPTNDIAIATGGTISDDITFAGNPNIADNGNTATLDESGVFDASGQTSFTATYPLSAETIGFSANELAIGSNGVNVTWQPGGLNNFLLEVDDAGPQASSVATFTLTARDVLNNPIPNYNPTNDINIETAGTISDDITFAGNPDITDSGNTATLDASGAFDANGKTSFTAEYDVSGETVTFSAREMAINSNGVDVTWIPNQPLLLRVDSINPSPPEAGQTFDITVRVTDLYDNVCGVLTTTQVELRLSVGSGVLTSSPVTLNPGDDTAVFANVTYDKAEDIVIAVDRTSGDTLVSGTYGPFEVTGGTPVQLFIETITNQQAGVGFDVNIKTLDALGNETDVTGNTPVILSIFSGTGALTGSTTATITDGTRQATFAGVICNTSQSGLVLRVEEDNATPSLAPGDSNPFIVASSGAHQLHIPMITQPSANIEFDVVVEVRDQYDNPTTAGAPSNVTLSLDTGTGNLTFVGPSTLPLNVGDPSVTFTCKYDMAEAGVIVEATDDGGLLSDTSLPFTVNASPPVRLRIDPIASPKTAGDLFDVVITSVDGSGNPALVASDTDVTLDVSTGSGYVARDGGQPLTVVLAASTSQVTITDAYYDTAETGVKLIAEATAGDSLAPAVSNAFDVDPAPALALRFVQQPTHTDLTTPLEVAVDVVDDYGNRVLAATDTITLSLVAPGGCGTTLYGTRSLAATAGLADYGAIGDLYAGQVCNGYCLKATAPSLASVTSNAFNVSAGRDITGPRAELVTSSSETILNVTYTITGSQTLPPFIIAYGLDTDGGAGAPIDHLFGEVDIQSSSLRTPGVHTVQLEDVRPELEQHDARHGERIAVWLDADDEVIEGTEGDNLTTVPIHIDLVLQSLVTDLQGAGSTSRVVYDVDSPASVPEFTVRVGLDENGDNVIDDVLKEVRATGRDVAPGSHIVPLNLTNALLSRQIINGAHVRVVARLDDDDEIREADETNNARCTTEQGYVDLLLSIVEAPQHVTPGQTLTCTWRLKNDGTADATDVVLTVPIPADAQFVGAEVFRTSPLSGYNPGTGQWEALNAIIDGDLAFIEVGTLTPAEIADISVVLQSLGGGGLDLWAEAATDTSTVRSAGTRITGSGGYRDPNAVVVEEITTTTRYVGLCGGAGAPLMIATLLGAIGLKGGRRGHVRSRHM